MTTKITSNNIESASLALLGGPKITAIAVTTSSYTVLDDTAVDPAGGYIKLAGTGFETSCQVVVNGVAATSVTFISATEVRAQLPATTAGTYIVYLINPTGGVAIRVNGVTFSAVPAWSTGSTLPNGVTGNAVSIQLGAASNSSITYALAAGSTLPTGLSLTTGGLLSGTVTVANATTYNFTLVATDAELQDTSRAFSITISVGEPYFKNTTLLLSGNGTNLAQNNTFVDSSSNNFAITRTGNATQGTFSPYGANWSLYTNGSSSYAYLPYSATRAIGTGDFSIECWVYIARQPANYTRVWSHQSNWGLAGSIGVELAFGTVDTLIQTLVDGNSTTYTSATYDTSNGSGHVRQWIHVVSSRQNGYLRLFVNGILREAAANSTNINGTSNTSFGTNSQLGGDLTELYISNFRMCIGSVPTAYSTTSTTAGTTIFTPSTTPVTTTSQGASGVQLLLFQDNRIIDRSSNAFAVTAVNNPSIQRFSPFGAGTGYSTTTIGGSGYFDGSGDYLDITGANCLLTGDFTVEAWVCPTSWGSYQRVISGGTSTFYWSLGFSITWGGGLKINWYDGADYFSSAPASIPLNTWYHLAVVRTGSTIYYYINGVQSGSGPYSTTPGNATGGITIGRRVAATEPWYGYITDARVVVGTNVYGTGATCTVPVAPLTAVANTRVLFLGTNAGIVDGTMQNNLETVGDAKISVAQSKFGGASMAFDGTGDYCFLPNTHAFLFGSGDFTIEAWVYINDTSTRKYILGPGTDTASHYKGFGFEIWGQQVCMWASSNGTGWDILESDTSGNRGATLLAINTWYHIAVSRSGSTFRSFVNGVVEKTFTSSATIFSDVTIPYNIGRSGYSPGGYFYYNGYIDDLRITRGYARYTGTFTPPAAALLAQ